MWHDILIFIMSLAAAWAGRHLLDWLLLPSVKRGWTRLIDQLSLLNKRLTDIRVRSVLFRLVRDMTLISDVRFLVLDVRQRLIWLTVSLLIGALFFWAYFAGPMSNITSPDVWSGWAGFAYPIISFLFVLALWSEMRELDRIQTAQLIAQPRSQCVHVLKRCIRLYMKAGMSHTEARKQVFGLLRRFVTLLR
jgi:hypothetical protein